MKQKLSVFQGKQEISLTPVADKGQLLLLEVQKVFCFRHVTQVQSRVLMVARNKFGFENPWARLPTYDRQFDYYVGRMKNAESEPPLQSLGFRVTGTNNQTVSMPKSLTKAEEHRLIKVNIIYLSFYSSFPNIQNLMKK